VVIRLAADRAALGQRAVALHQQVGRLELRLGARQRGLLAVVAGLVEGRVDLVELLAGADFAAFGEQALLDDTVDLRPDFRDPVGAGARSAERRGGEGWRSR